MLLRPGATPQSTTAVTPRALASASSSNGSSPKNEISTTFFPASMIARSVAKPMNPGTAPITRSASRTTLWMISARDKSATSPVSGCSAANASTRSRLASTAVTRYSRHKSAAIALPTMPAPKTTMCFMSTPHIQCLALSC